MSVNVERLSENSVKVTVEVSAEEFDQALDKAFEKVVKDVKADGFRPGKMPKTIFIQRYGWSSLYQDALQFVFESTYPKAVMEAKVFPTDEPKVDLDYSSLEKGKGFTYTAEVDVWPEVHLGEYKGIKVKPLSTRVLKKDIDEEVKKVLDTKVENVIKDTPAENGDTVVIDFEGFVNGVAFDGGKADNYPLELGSKSFIPGFEDQLIGAKSEDEVEVNVTFPKDYHESLAGKDATFKVKVHEVKGKVYPELNDELIKKLKIENVETVDAYKEKVKTDLTAQKEREAEENFTNELLGKVCDNANVEIPAVMIDAEVDRMYKEFEGRMQQSGFTAKQFLEATHQTEEAIRAQMSPEAAARVKTQLVLEAIVKAESIEASDEDVEKEFTTMSEMYNMEVEKIKSLISPESIKADLANQKALDFIKTSVK